MKHGILYYILALIIVTAGGANGADPRGYTCCLLRAEPVLDGKIEDTVWNTAPEAKGFFILGGTNAAIERPTSFRAGWTTNALYLAVKCIEPAPGKLVANQPDDGKIWWDDSVELFISPEPDKSKIYYQLAVNSRGCRWNGVGSDRNELMRWEAKSFIGKDCWSLEIKIPFETIGQVPYDGKLWKFNLARNVQAVSTAEKHTTWSPLKGGFRDPLNFGWLYFKAVACSPEEVAANLPEALYLRWRVKEIAGEYPKYKDALDKGLSYEGFKNEAGLLKSQWEWIERINGQEKMDPAGLISGFGQSERLIEKTKNFKDRVLMESLFRHQSLCGNAQENPSISCSDWTIEYNSRTKVWSAFNKGKPVIVNADAFIGTADKQRALSSGEYSARPETSVFEDELGKGKELKVILTDKGNWMNAALSLRLYENKDWILARLKIKNISGQPQLLRELQLLRITETGGLFIGNDPQKAKYMTQGWAMQDGYGIYPLETATGTKECNWSPFVMALHNPESGESAVVGFSKNEHAFNWVNIRYDKNCKSPGEVVQITAQSSYMDYNYESLAKNQWCSHNMSLPGTGKMLSAGKELVSDELMINFSPDVLASLEEFGDVTGRRQAMKIPNITPIDWQSWSCLISESGGIKENVVYANFEACTKLLKPWGFNECGRGECVRNPGSEKDAIRKLKTLGYPLVYFSLSPAISHPPLSGELVTLGYNHIYTDFMCRLLGQGTNSASDSAISHAKLYRKRYMAWTENVRQKAKEQGVDFIFTGFSGGPMGLSVGLVNTMRMGPDTPSGSYSNWAKSVDPSKEPSIGTYSTCYRVGVIQSIMPALAGRWWMHNRLWKNYLDGLKVGEPLGVDQARARASLVGLSGQEFSIEDKLAGDPENKIKYIIPPLDVERLAILRKALPVCDVQLQKGELFRPMGLWARQGNPEEPKRLPNIYIRKICRPWKDWYLVGAFNLDDMNTQDVALDLSDLKWDWKNGYLLFDFWEEKFLGKYSEQPVLKAPPYGCRVLAVHPDTGDPQVLSSNRHITQGGVDLEDVSWNKDQKILRGVSNGYPMQNYALWVYVPPKFKYEKITANVPVEAKKLDKNILKLSFNVSSPEPIKWALQF